MSHFISGAIMMGELTAAIFFLRFWRDTRDRLFAMFSGAFLLLAIQRIGLEFAGTLPERSTPWYCVRVLAFVLIILAFLDKNRSRKQ